MVSAIWDSIKGKKNPKTNKPFTESDAYAMATARWKSMGHKAPSSESLKDWHIVEFFVPIQETNSNGNEFFIKGIAINETTTRNGIKYIAKELERAAPSFRNKPILLDHKNEIRNIVGRTTENVKFELGDDGLGKIPFEARIHDVEIQQMIKDGRIQDVSIGAKVQDLIQNKDTKEVTATGIEGLEISLVAVPGDPGANIGQALENSFMLKEKFNDEEDDFSDEEPEEDIEEEQMITCPGCGMKYDVGKKKWEEKEEKEEKVSKSIIKEEIILKLN